MTGRVWLGVDVEEEAGRWKQERTVYGPEAGEATSGQAHLRSPAGFLVCGSPASVVPRAVVEGENRKQSSMKRQQHMSKTNFHILISPLPFSRISQLLIIWSI